MISGVRTVEIGPIRLGGGLPLVLIAGPCVIESEAHAAGLQNGRGSLQPFRQIGLQQHGLQIQVELAAFPAGDVHQVLDHRVHPLSAPQNGRDTLLLSLQPKSGKRALE